MNTQEVIDTISRATDELCNVLRQSQATIEDQAKRIEKLESQLDWELDAHSATKRMHVETKDMLSNLQGQHTAAKVELSKLHDIILSIATAVEPIVSPKTDVPEVAVMKDEPNAPAASLELPAANPVPEPDRSSGVIENPSEPYRPFPYAVGAE